MICGCHYFNLDIQHILVVITRLEIQLVGLSYENSDIKIFPSMDLFK